MLIHSLKRLAKPIKMPLSIEEVKVYLKIDNHLEDALLEDIIQAAATSFEDNTGTALMSQLWQVIYKNLNSAIIDLPIKPVIEIIDVHVISINDAKKITKYKKINDSLMLNIISDADLLSVNFKAGINLKGDFIPSNIKLLLLEHIAFLYLNRGENDQFNDAQYTKFRTIKC